MPFELDSPDEFFLYGAGEGLNESRLRSDIPDKPLFNLRLPLAKKFESYLLISGLVGTSRLRFSILKLPLDLVIPFCIWN